MSLSEPPEEHLRLVELEAAVLADVEAYGRCPLVDKPRVAKLSAVIQDRLGRIRALTRDLELAAEEAEGEEEEQRALAAMLAQHKAEYARIQAAFKQAAVDQRTAALKSAAEERRELLAGGEAGLRQRRAQTEADAAALAEDVTGGLRRTRQVLAEELEHTSATLAAMEASHAQLGKTKDEYHGQHRHLRKSKGLLGTLDWQAKSETYMLWFGLTLFLAVCAYIFQKRAGHFVPNALKPTTLLAGRQPVPAPSLLRRPAGVPLHKTGGGLRQPPAMAHQPQPHVPRHQQRRPPASPVPATQQQGEPQVGGADEAVWPSGAPELGTEQPQAAESQQQQQVSEQQQQPPQQPGQGAGLPPPPRPVDQPAQQQQPEQPVQQEQPQPDIQEKPAEQQQAPDLLEPVPAEPEGQHAEQAGGEAQQAPSGGGALEAGEQPAADEQQAADSGAAAEAQAQPEGAGSEAELAAAVEAAAAALSGDAAGLEQAAEQAAAAAAQEVAAGEAAADAQAGDAAAAAAAAAESQGQAAGGEPSAVGPEGAPEPDKHAILDRQGRRIAVDPIAEFVRSPLGGPPAGEPAGGEAPRDEL
ncbi:ATP-dependent zinc metalloprotease FTSH mitochondrial [Chlorella sorokiniana]|uniref:ATP-dependent zinc metalloprotease FTSH mitochondrial n=1 Tax=Chlorella sorokiniana TaxID=3076 RepID=A0A2P6TQM0_CHLSO|nr:ATP-dependent zinc metalloprotease FTSH mitochondrial [Chlorella sorokiniana]|eukprot:PRW56334.1 ATP-dependent zinc metalloprotease FTSH mitochondrial [Chlorella sorokiniana]